MDVEERLEETVDSRVTLERTAGRNHDGTVRYVVYCEEDARGEVGEQLEAIKQEVVFETIQ